MPALFAFLHHVAAFALVAALAIEFVLLKGELDARAAARLRVVDAVLGASAAVLLVVGLVRVFHFEKGAAYYFHNAAFLAKLALFLAIALLSIYPTLQFLSWGRAVKAGQLPIVSERKLRAVRRIVHWELAGVVVVILCAALMARGFGTFG